MFSIIDTKGGRFTMPTRAQSLAVARRATFCALAAVGVAACGAEAPEPEGSSDPAAPSPGPATRDGTPIEKALFGPNEFASADNCSGLQQAAVLAAEDLANVLMGRAQDALAEVYIANDLGTRFTGSDPAFEGRFGPLNETTWSEVYDRYTGISQAMLSRLEIKSSFVRANSFTSPVSHLADCRFCLIRDPRDLRIFAIENIMQKEDCSFGRRESFEQGQKCY